MDIDIKIENIKRYFSHKMAVDEFILLKVEQHVTLIDVDGYQFSMWISNGLDSFDFFGDPFSGVQGIKFDFMNDDQKKLAFNNVMNKVDDYKHSVTKQYLINNIAEMQKELKQLENE